MTWISCKNPPNIGENVIATDGNKSFAAWYTGESWENKEDRLVGRVIAWMPFPEFILEGVNKNENEMD